MFKAAASITNSKAKTPALILWLVASILSSPVSADTQLNITGRIKSSPCKVDLPTRGLTVDLGQKILASSLAVAGSSTSWRPFSIVLSECPIAINKVTMTLNGTADQIENTMYANTGTSSRVQIEVQSSAGTSLGNMAQMVQNVDAASRGTTFNMQARVHSAQGNATPGTIVGTMQVTFTYQ
ncbi:minor fimbrial subunit [Izhakiella capsodis]|uniref:Minor fimbrial subunit n=1 Tax=Izhakiella capsodis TaxID=1367852 RepID=A0A1I4XFW1_9GAMM|nr:fimbrial protein [Izhakiella capsodis]SFN24416.1 minor fimbrial subunit [Izhakiella capsodis]